MKILRRDLHPRTQLVNCSIICGDCVEQLSKLESGSIPLTVCSPPYDSLRDYSGAPWNFEALALELFRATRPGGVVCWNVGDSTVDGSETLTSFRQALFFKDKCGFKVHDTMIYEKSNGSKPNPRRYNQVMEYIFVLSKGVPKTVNLIMDKANVTAGKSVFGRHTMREKDGSMTLRKNRIIAKEYGVRGNVWKGNTRGQEDVCRELPHPAMMPRWLAHDLILSFSNADDTVLDPMCGSGTTGSQAVALGRNFIGIEISAEFCELARKFCDVTPGFVL